METDGFTGIYINDMTYSSDMLLVVALLLLSGFAVIFRRNVPVFATMTGHIASRKQENSIFDPADKDNFLFNIFMNFQTITLLSIYTFSFATKYGNIEPTGIKMTLLCVAGLIFIFFIFHVFKRSVFNILLYVFAASDGQKILAVNNKSLFRLWGVFLYIPVFWILLIGNYIFYATILLIISYLIFRVILAFRFFNVFFGKNMWLLFLNLYLCAQEIVPLVLLYEGLNYLYDMIDKNNIWQ